MSGNLVQDGIDAFKAGDKARAVSLLSEAVRQPENKMNEEAWYYLAAAQSDPARRKQALEVVLRINPSNARAQGALDKVNAQLSGDSAAAFSEPAAVPKRKTPTYSADVDVQPPSSGFKLPVDIPDAPPLVDIGYIISLFIAIFKNGVAILQRKEGAYEAELNRATWWRFWVYLGVGSLIIAVLSAISSLLLQLQFSNLQIFGVRYAPNYLAPVFTLILTVPITAITYYGAARASYAYASGSAGGQGQLVHHAYVGILPGLTASLIGNLLNVVFALIPGLNFLAAIVAFVLSIYALFVMVDGFEIIHGYERNKGWITAAIQVLAAIVIGIALGVVLGLFTAPAVVTAF